MKQTFKRFALSAMCLLFAFAAMAQVTTSSMSGRVTDGKETLPGATVKVTHVPSGTMYVVTTNNDGRYAIQGMRTGGPYRVEFMYIGFADDITNDVFLQLGETYVLNAQLKEAETTLSEVVITATRATKFTTEKTGASTNVNNQQMQLLPTVSRSISEVSRYSPYVGTNNMSFAGGDGRSGNLTVDGANLNNNFGLSSSLPGGGNPISIDAIEEVQVVVAPFDVRQTNFIGGGLNAITKSGTNTIKGSAYIYHRNQDMRGNRIGDLDFGTRNKESRTVYGVTLGAPIIKNKLFFFGSYEYEKSPQQVVRWRASTDGVFDNNNYISRVTESDLQKVSDHLKSKYGYDTGSFRDFPADETNLKYLVRLDWNINTAHKFSLRYNHTKNMAWNAPNGNSADVNTRSNEMRTSAYSMSYANSMYSMDNIVNTIAGELNSRINDNMSNQLVATYSLIKDVRGSTSSDFPFIDILSGDITDGTSITNSYIAAGYELFTWNNGVTNKVTNITDNFTYYLNSHKLMAGISFEHQYADNNYMRNATGYYRYASVSDFLNGATPIDFALTYGANGNKTPSNAVEFRQLGVYLQDEWNVLDNLKFTIGVRADNLTFVNDIMRNNAIYDLDFGGRKIDTGAWPQSRINWSPRLGFTYDMFHDRSLVLRGGTGIFTGRLPLVFFTNMPSNAGMNQLLMRVNSTFNPDGTANLDPRLELLNGGLVTDIDEMIRIFNFQTVVTPESGSLPSSIAGVDSKFKMPQVWKTALAVDYQFPVQFPFTATIEGMFTKNINAIMLDNYALRTSESDSWEKFSGPDNRVIYPSNMYYNSTVRDAAVLTNTNKGYGYTFNVTLQAQPVRDLNMMAAFTKTEMKEVSGMPGSAASSAWQGLYTVNGPNLNTAQRSQYVLPSRFIASISYKLPDMGYKSTTISLFYQGASSYYTTFRYANDMNGDGIANDLIYIPSKKGDIKFISQADEDAFFKFMEQDKYLSKNKGKYAESYAVRAPYSHRFDLRILQDFYVKAGKTRNTLQLSVDVMNVGNIINSEWGLEHSPAVSNNGMILRYEGRDANNVPSFSMPKVAGEYPTKTWDLYRNYSQCWYMQVGLRYLFN